MVLETHERNSMHSVDIFLKINFIVAHFRKALPLLHKSGLCSLNLFSYALRDNFYEFLKFFTCTFLKKSTFVQSQ